jgi:hypothetical protein
LTKEVLNVGRFNPKGAVRKTFVVEDESMRNGYSIVQAGEKKILVRT